jgi:hypothetical protein
MSFNSFGGPGSFRPLDDRKPPAYWKELLIATLPAFVASVMPPVVMHYLQRDKAPKGHKKAKKPSSDESDADAT